MPKPIPTLTPPLACAEEKTVKRIVKATKAKKVVFIFTARILSEPDLPNRYKSTSQYEMLNRH
jgi:hypothetical protein